MDPAGGCVAQLPSDPIPLHMPIRKVYAWRNSEDQQNCKWAGVPQDFQRGKDNATKHIDVQPWDSKLSLVIDNNQVRNGIPRTISLPQMSPESSDSPDNRPDASLLETALMPPTPLQSAFSVGADSSSSMPSSAISSFSRLSGGKFSGSGEFLGIDTAPYQRSADWPMPLPVRIGRPAPRPTPRVTAESLTEALQCPRLGGLPPLSVQHGPAPFAAGSFDDRSCQLGNNKRRGSSDALSALSSSFAGGSGCDYLAVSSSYQAAPLQRRKQHGSTDALGLLQSCSSLTDLMCGNQHVRSQDTTSAANSMSSDSFLVGRQVGASDARHWRSGDWGPKTPQQLPPLPPATLAAERNEEGPSAASDCANVAGIDAYDPRPMLRLRSTSPFGLAPTSSWQSSLDGSSQLAGSHSFGNLRVVTPTGPVPLQTQQQQPPSGCFEYGSGAWGGIDVPPYPGHHSMLSTVGSTGTVSLSLAQCAKQPQEQELLQRGSCAALESLGGTLGSLDSQSTISGSLPQALQPLSFAARSSSVPAQPPSCSLVSSTGPVECGQPRTVSCHRSGSRFGSGDFSLRIRPSTSAASLQLPSRQLSAMRRQDSVPANFSFLNGSSECTMKGGLRRGSSATLHGSSRASSQLAHSPSPVQQMLADTTASEEDDSLTLIHQGSGKGNRAFGVDFQEKSTVKFDVKAALEQHGTEGKDTSSPYLLQAHMASDNPSDNVSDKAADTALRPLVPRPSPASPQRSLKVQRRSLESRLQPEAPLPSGGSLADQLSSFSLSSTPPRSPSSFLQLPAASCSFAEVAAAADERRLAFGCCSWPHDAVILEPASQQQQQQPLSPSCGASVEATAVKQEDLFSALGAACMPATAVKVVPRVESDDGLDDCKPSSFFTVLPTILDDIAES